LQGTHTGVAAAEAELPRRSVLWLFTSEETYRRQHAALRTIGRAGYLKDARS
jgi:hypothetical protein